MDIKSRTTYVNSYLEVLCEVGLACGITNYTRIELQLKLISKFH